jgi:adenylylsulfate kinase
MAGSNNRKGDSHTRSITKAISWRVLATITTMSIVYYFTGSLNLSLGVGILDVVIKIIIYYFHERTWNKIGWGKY